MLSLARVTISQLPRELLMIWEKGQASERVQREGEMISRAIGFETKCNQSPEDPWLRDHISELGWTAETLT